MPRLPKHTQPSLLPKLFKEQGQLEYKSSCESMDSDCKSICSVDTKHTYDLTDDDMSHHTTQREESKRLSKSPTWYAQQHRRSTSPTDNLDTLSPKDILKKRYHQSNFSFVSLADIEITED
ncbi:hypothetical protein EON63_05675 [archaeon]|nr:MAG: hypothetical protein EON63_05675 [archaeon]